MESKIAKGIALKHKPVAIVWSDQKPEEAAQFKEHKWGCIIQQGFIFASNLEIIL